MIVFCIIAANSVPPACRFDCVDIHYLSLWPSVTIRLLFPQANCWSQTIKETFKDVSSIVHTHTQRYTLFCTNALLKMLLGWSVTKLYPCKVKKIKAKWYLLQCVIMFSIIPEVWWVPRCEQLNLLSMYAAGYPVWDLTLRKCGTWFKCWFEKTSYLFWNFVCD